MWSKGRKEIFYAKLSFYSSKASQEKCLPSKEFSQPHLRVLPPFLAGYIYVPCMFLVFLFPFFVLFCLSLLKAQGDRGTCICTKRQCVITVLEGGWPHGRSPRHHFPPSVELACMTTGLCWIGSWKNLAVNSQSLALCPEMVFPHSISDFHSCTLSYTAAKASPM